MRIRVNMGDAQLTREVTGLHAELCSALADPNRILLLYALQGGPKSVHELTLDLGITQPATSRHLKVLRERGLLKSTRDGQSIQYEICDTRILTALDTLRAVLRDGLSYRAHLASYEGAETLEPR